MPYGFRGFNLDDATGGLITVEDDGTTPITSSANGLNFIDGALLIDTGALGVVSINSAGYKVNERGALYCAVDGVIDFYKDGVGFTVDGILVTTQV